MNHRRPGPPPRPFFGFFPVALAVALSAAYPAGADGPVLDAAVWAVSSASAAGEDGEPVIVDGTSVVRPRIELAIDALTLSFSPRLRFGTSGGVSLTVEELALGAAVAGRFPVAAGVFVHRPGPAFVLSNVDFFSPWALDRLVEEGPFGNPGLPDRLIRAGYDDGAWRAVATFAPFAYAAATPGSGSPWMTVGNVRNSFDSALGTVTYELRDIVGEEGIDPWSIDPACSVELGYSGEAFGATLYGFYGPDRNPVVNLKATTLGVSAFGFYDLRLRREVGHVLAVGLDASSGFGSMEAFVDAAWMGNRILTVGSPYDAVDEWPATMEAAGVLYTIGFSVDLPWPDSSARLEWRNSWYATDVSMANPPVLERAAAVRGRVAVPGIPVAIVALGLYSLEDGSWAAFPGVEADPSPACRVRLDALLFGGGEGTELGRLAGGTAVRLSIELRP